jgi:hypothetical protein
MLKSIRSLDQFEARITHAAHLFPIDQTRQQTTAILSRVKPVGRFVSET